MAAKENLSQRVLLELLTKEIETLKKSSEVVKQAVPIIEQQMNKIATTKIHVDASNVQQVFKDKQILKTWQLVFVAVISGLLLVAIGTTTHFYMQSEKWENNAAHWFQKAVELGYESESK